MTWHIMDIKRDDTCVGCGEFLPAGTRAVWFKTEKVTRCVPCAASHVDPASGEAAVDPAPVPTLPPATATARAPEPPRESVAGGSAQSEYEKRSARELARKQKKVEEDAQWRQAVKERHPILGRIAAATTPKPTITPESQSTKAWKIGAEGERRVAEVLAAAEGVLALHDVTWPGRSKANIDHIAIAPSGIYVIDAKKYSGLIELRNVGGTFRQNWQLFVGGRNQTKLVDSALSQAEALRTLLGDALAAIPVMPVLCFIESTWNRPQRPVVLKGVTCVWPVKLTEHVSAPGNFGPIVPSLADHLRTVLRPAG